ncbi:MAG: hypothetical protein M3R00_01035 [Pseudomonadota bacterium]|nr:hypothetical protein [Pseudomonadota bacterium]
MLEETLCRATGQAKCVAVLAEQRPSIPTLGFLVPPLKPEASLRSAREIEGSQLTK